MNIIKQPGCWDHICCIHLARCSFMTCFRRISDSPKADQNRLLNKQFWVMPRAWSRLQVSNFGLRGPFFDAHSVCQSKPNAAKSASDLRRAAADFAAAEFARITPRKRWLVARDFHWILLCTLSSSLGVGITSVAFILLDILS